MSVYGFYHSRFVTIKTLLICLQRLQVCSTNQQSSAHSPAQSETPITGTSWGKVWGGSRVFPWVILVQQHWGFSASWVKTLPVVGKGLQKKHTAGTALFWADTTWSYLSPAALTLSAAEHSSAQSFGLRTLHNLYALQHLQQADLFN